MTLITFARAPIKDRAMLGSSEYERHHADHYPTPAWVTRAVIPYLLKHIDAEVPVWECACGSGEMAEVLSERFEVRCTDLHDRGYPCEELDFLKSEPLNERTAVVTNPPYFENMPERFIRHALQVTKETEGVVAMLLRHEYDCAKERVDLFNQPPFARQVVLTSRPRWIPGSRGAPRHNYSWYIWSHGWTGEPVKNYHVR